ncbi:BTAD domain-containing putative transcriptional regulator [Frankia sp. QA3]|uniref:BTAD domain-containing putative transcriptional regulator n=1 Tax=Frankia sp. QA3 TaxID=710111 RepID=UPI000269CE99|nr:BTAD domain-containing putative transcriptional regulator [Frankia sp. QA3]EIV96216.1 DNA-binding transcriptional activator of the SARP family [Frankia sp. QA3]
MDIRLLGPVQLLRSGLVVDVGRPQRCLVLAALAADAGRPVSTETLIQRVWGDDGPDHARRSLHAHVSRLRRLLERHSDEQRTVRIVRRVEGYVLDLDSQQVDLIRMRGLLEQARAAAGDDARLPLLREAVRLWRGEPLAGLASSWVDRIRQSCWEERRDVVVAWASAELSAGNAPAVIEPLRELAYDDLHHQRLVTVLMRGLYATGRSREAQALYQSAYDQIVKNEGLELDPEMMRVQVGILRGDLDVQAPQHRAPTTSRGQAPSTPLMVGNLPPRADSFQDRAEFRKLHGATGPGQTTVLTQVVAGLGGVGKTQLAAEFARQLWDAGELDLMLWVSALSRDSVVSDYVQAGTELVRAGTDLALGPENEAPERTAARLLTWLARTRRRWLIVLDDLAGPADIRDLWPPDRPNGRTVVTTRRRDADLLAGRNLVELDVFTVAEAVEYLYRKFRDHPHLADTEEAVRGVVTDLGGLPLALGHAAAYMIDLDLPCSLYRGRFADRRRRLTELFPTLDTVYDGYSHTVATTWALSIEAANRLPPVGLARPLLEIVSSLNPNGIPDGVLTKAPTAQRYLAGRVPRQPTADDIHDGLRGLHRFHLVTHQSGMIRVHALVQRAVREDLGEVRSTEVARTSADALLEIWPPDDNNEDRGQLLRANAMALQDNWAAAIWNPDHGIHKIMMRTIESLGTAVQLEEAIRLCRQLSQQAVEYFGPRHPDTLILRDQLAMWLGDAGQTQEAITSLGSLIPDMVAVFGRDHPTTTAARRNLGYQWGQAGYPAQAVAELTTVLADQVRVLGPEHPAVLTIGSQLVYWRSKTGDTAGAVAELESLVQLATRIHGPEHRDTFDLRGLLATIRAQTVGYAQSVLEMQQVLDDMLRVLGPQHRDVSVLRNNLAMHQWKAGDGVAAAAVLQDLVTERMKSHGLYHRDTVATRHGLSQVLVDLEDFAGAAAELDEVIKGMSQLAGPRHPDTLHRRYELACVYERMGRQHQAAEDLQAVLTDQLAVLGDSDEAVTATKEALARLTGGPAEPTAGVAAVLPAAGSGTGLAVRPSG